jgi:hypothetical protein
MKLFFLIYCIIFQLILNHVVDAKVSNSNRRMSKQLRKEIVSGNTTNTNSNSGNRNCVVFDLTSMSTAIKASNGILKLAQDSGLVKALAKSFDPISLKSISLPPKSFTILGANFTVQLIVEKAVLGGLKTIQLSPTDILGPTKLNVGGGLGDLNLQDLDMTVDLNGMKIPITNMFQVKDSSFSATLDLQILHCASGLFSMCGLKAGSALLKSFSSGQVTDEVMKRIKSVKVESAKVKFGNIENMKLDIGNETSLPSQVINTAMDYVKTTLNSPGFLHDGVEGIISAMIPLPANDVINSLSSQFGGSC